MSVSLRKLSFEFECWRCGMRAAVRVPRVFCDDCRPVVAEQMHRQAEDARIWVFEKYGITVGDRVRLKTAAEKEFERDVLADLADL